MTSKPFGTGSDYPNRSVGAGKSIREFTGGGALNFTELKDAVRSYAGLAGKFIAVNATETGLTAVAATALQSAVDALELAVAALEASVNADPLALGVDIDFAQFEALGFRLEQIAGNPGSPINGQMWYNTSTGKPMVRIAGVNCPFYLTADASALAAVIACSNLTESLKNFFQSPEVNLLCPVLTSFSPEKFIAAK